MRIYRFYGDIPNFGMVTKKRNGGENLSHAVPGRPYWADRTSEPGSKNTFSEQGPGSQDVHPRSNRFSKPVHPTGMILGLS